MAHWYDEAEQEKRKTRKKRKKQGVSGGDETYEDTRGWIGRIFGGAADTLMRNKDKAHKY